MERADADAAGYEQNNQDSIGRRESDHRNEYAGDRRAKYGEESSLK